jgi:PKD repeat protein
LPLISLAIGFNQSKIQKIIKSLQNAASISWDFGDGTNSTAENPVHTYTAAGNNTVNLTAINGNGTASKLATITVLNRGILATAFSASPTSGHAPLSVSFTDLSTGLPISWEWLFGDGINSTQQNPTHIYSKAGQYSVTLTVGNLGGNGTETMFTCVTVK